MAGRLSSSTSTQSPSHGFAEQRLEQAELVAAYAAAAA